MDIRELVATNIRRIRKSQGLTQEALAEKSGLHRTYIGGIEQRRINVSIKNIEQIAQALGIEASELFVDHDGRGPHACDFDSIIGDTDEAFALCERDGDALTLHPIHVQDPDLAIHILSTLIRQGYRQDALLAEFDTVQSELIDYFDRRRRQDESLS